jgi:hypothetical protein
LPGRLHSEKIVGYAIAVQTELTGFGVVSWVTQLVVQEEHRQSDVGKTLLLTIWQFSDHFAWGCGADEDINMELAD